MPEFTFDLKPIDIGADYSFDWQWLQDDVEVDLTGYSATFILYCHDPEDPELSITSGSGAITLDAEGNIHGTITKAAIAAAKLEEGDYSFQLDLTKTAGDVTTRLAKGHISALKEKITAEDP